MAERMGKCRRCESRSLLNSQASPGVSGDVSIWSGAVTRHLMVHVSELSAAETGSKQSQMTANEAKQWAQGRDEDNHEENRCKNDG